MQENEAAMAIVSGNEDIKIIIDRIEVLREVPTIATAVAMFFKLTYALHIKYPKNLQYILEFVHKVLMELGGKKVSPKIQRLSAQLYSQEKAQLSSTVWPDLMTFLQPRLCTLLSGVGV